MRDTSCLRAKIALIACLPGLAACSPPAKPQPLGEGDEAKDAAKEAHGEATEPRPADRVARVDGGKTSATIVPPKKASTKAEAKAEGTTPATPDPSTTVSPPQASHAEGMVGFPGDPPFIDGYNPEEDTCISGNWCGAGPAAAAVGVPQIPEEMGCPTRISGGSKSSERIKDDPKTYEGLSAAPNMQGALNRHGTELARAKPGGDGMCCYHWFEYCSGRPHLGDDGPVLAPVRAAHDPRDGWSDEALAEPASVAALPAALRQALASAWLQDARAEHASVAAFARATLELMAVGAPPSLLEQAQRAGLDEIEHARTCFALAARYGARAMQPGPLPALAPRPASLPRLAADTFAEGCVGETIAALAVRRAARDCTDATLKDALERIADDEARHAALAWSTVAWALREGGDAVAEHLQAVAASLQPSPHEALPPEEPQARVMRSHGRLDARAHALAGREAWDEIIAPMLDQLLDGSSRNA